MSIEIELEHSFKRALKDGINLFLGAGFPVLAWDVDNRIIPSGNGLKAELIGKFGLGYGEQLSLAQISTILEASRREEFYTFLRRRFSVATYDPRYSILDQVCLSTLFTTNIDDLLFKVFASSERNYLNDMLLRGPSFRDRKAVDLVTLHGSITHENEPLVFSTLDITTSFADDPDRWHVLTQRLQAKPTLFWGYSLGDASVLQALSPTSVHGRQHAEKWILLREADDGAIEYFRALGFRIIVSDTSSMLDFIGANVAPVSPHKPKSPTLLATSELFPEEALPSVGTVPVRSLLEFYLGAGPSWYDIYSGQLHRTNHYDAVIDLLDAGRNVVVIGLPACGKTTLMMQVAANATFAGHKLITQSLTKEKAQLISNRLLGAPAMMFVDNFTDDVDAFNTLVAAPNIQAVGFDRDYAFEIASHRLLRDHCSIYEASGLSEFDIQQIFARIPLQIRTDHFVAVGTEGGVIPSLFEVIEANIERPTIKARFRSVLNQLQREKPLLHDILVMVCYLHSCRVPVSYDTISAFLRGQVTDYHDVFTLVEELGSMIVEYGGRLVEENQDYFISRSAFLSEAILDQVSPGSFKAILTRFHEKVSPLRICRYDVFKRKAFDEMFARKAFLAWREGMEFYEKMFSRDRSAYVRQQGALYLLHKGRKREAFKWIDEAVVLSGNAIPSIRNTYAIILFKTNIDIPDTDGTVRETLRQSMQILSHCYFDDKRKTYHAVAFADQALQYHRVFPDEHRALEYLQTADHWLDEEARQSPWNRNVKRLQRQVKARLVRL